MNKLFHLLSLAAVLTATALLSSCETTGDPSSGGLFWSPKKFEQQEAEKQLVQDNIEQDTDKQRAKAASLNQQIQNAQ